MTRYDIQIEQVETKIKKLQIHLEYLKQLREISLSNQSARENREREKEI